MVVQLGKKRSDEQCLRSDYSDYNSPFTSESNNIFNWRCLIRMVAQEGLKIKIIFAIQIVTQVI